MNEISKRLKALLSATSKHSAYQLLPDRLMALLKVDDLIIRSRYEKERLDYILSWFKIEGKSILDIGGNTGYFTFEMLEHGSGNVTYIEGNVSHAEFVKEAAGLLGFTDRITVKNAYYDFSKSSQEAYFDLTLLLNVLHHVGDDFGDKELSIAKAKENMIESLNAMASRTGFMVFQLGFCWQGNRNKLLFENGTKSEMIDFIKKGIEGSWEVIGIGIAEKINDQVIYREASEGNLQRADQLGEFLNRPLFLLKSLH